MIHVVTFLWGDKYSADYVNKLAAGVRRNLSAPYRFVAVTDRAQRFTDAVHHQAPIANRDLLAHPGCFCRLRIFDPRWQQHLGIAKDERIAMIDLDAIITGELEPLFVEREAPFIILQGVNNPDHPCKYNGSVWSLLAGYRPDVWHTFSLAEAEKAPKKSFADDQGFLQMKIPNAAAYTHQDGVYAFMKTSWPGGISLPDNARIVAFPGGRDPSHFTVHPWVRQHWSAE